MVNLCEELFLKKITLSLFLYLFSKVFLYSLSSLVTESPTTVIKLFLNLLFKKESKANSIFLD